MTRKPGMWICSPPTVRSSAPPIVHSTTMKVAADKQGLGDAADEVHRRFGCDAHIVGDAVFGIGVVARHQIELIVPAVGEPAVDDVVADPGAPAALQGHAHIDLQRCSAAR